MLLEVLLSLVLVWLVRFIIATCLTRRNMPPGPFPFPVIGNLPHLLRDPINPFDKLAEKYGDIFTVTLPLSNIPTVVINTATLVREARFERRDDIAGRLSGQSYWHEIFGEDLLSIDYSPVYRLRKRVFKSATHLFGAGIEQASERARHAVDTMIEDIEMKKGQPFSPKELFEASILVQLWEWLTSKRLKIDDPTIQKLSNFSKIVVGQALASKLYQLIPFSSNLPTNFRHNVMRAKQIKNELFLQEFCTHKATYNPGFIRDLTDSFINSYENEISKYKTRDIEQMEVIPGLMADVAFAGSDTTSSSLAWLLLYMVLHPDVQEKIQKELDSIVGCDRLPSLKDGQNMHYLWATLCEVQRASGTITFGRTNAIRDTTIAGYHIPKTTSVIVNYPKLHHDEREWSEPEKFKPERFLDSDGKFVGWNKLHGFLPFSIGRRECAGQSLAKIMMFTFASILLHRYNIELPEGEKIPTTEVFVPAIVMPPTNYKVVARIRKSFVN